MLSIRDYRDSFRVRAKTSPLSFYPIAWLKLNKRERLVSRDTEIVIEGFPRSANTFFVDAFNMAQPAPVKVAHHFHAASQIILGAKWNIPTVVLIRDPVDAVVSSLIFDPSRTSWSWLREYRAFYRALLPYRHQFVTSRFEESVSDVAGVTKRVNLKYGTNFGLFQNTLDNVESVFSSVNGRAEALGQGPSRVARPHESRASMKPAIERKLFEGGNREVIREVKDLYAEFLSS